jgi:hypothetical protein
MAGSIAKMKAAADLIEKSNIGYDQGATARFSLFDGKKIIPNKETDCSACCGVIARLGGYPVDLSGTFYTGNIAAKLKAAGFDVFHFTKLSDLEAGDFVVKPGKHVEFVYGKNKFYSAHIDERGKTSGGKAGDQTGKETSFRSAYNYPWDYIIRPPAEAAPVPAKKPAAAKPTTSAKAKHKVGDKVSFTELWTQANNGKKVRASVKSGKITRILAGAAHPYLVGNGIGWLSDKEIR